MTERSHRGIGFDYEAALENPSRQFESPEQIRLYPWITEKEKVALLRAWAARLEASAKSGGEPLEKPMCTYQRILLTLRDLRHPRHDPAALRY